jgi:hypothetical protein
VWLTFQYGKQGCPRIIMLDQESLEADPAQLVLHEQGGRALIAGRVGCVNTNQFLTKGYH